MLFFKKKEKTPGTERCNMENSYQHILREFGEEFSFSSRTIIAGKSDIESFTNGARKNVEEKYHGADIALFESTVYRKILRLSLSIPTFDSADREYDSWHDLYLLQKHDRTLCAVYCTGGYHIAKVEGYIKVVEIPEPLKKYFD